MNDLKKTIAKYLIQSNAIKLNPTNPFTWASGLKSPIYCDNRITLSYHEVRTAIARGFVSIIQEQYPKFQIIAGVATGAIAHGILVADKIEKPFIYVRSAPKEHGLQNLIEGRIITGADVVVIEDLISTGGSSLNAVRAIRNEKMNVLGMVAIFTYGFEKAQKAFTDENCTLTTLTNYDTLIETAKEMKIISDEELSLLQQWKQNPEEWGK
ncbi:MAG: orotate phosphoribosyltransferase [Bacteroidales bacterium]